jgi:hypothetical protein
VAAVTIVPDDAPAPDDDAGAIAALAGRTRGRAIALRAGEVAARRADLAAELSRPRPLRAPTAVTGKATAVDAGELSLPDRIDAGGGAIAFGFYRGAAPTRLAILAEGAAGPVRIAALRDDGLLAAAALPLALVRAELDGIALDPDAADPAAASLTARARRTPAVTSFTSLVALLARDRFARDRLAMMRKWDAATFFRLPPPPELDPGHAFAPFVGDPLPTAGPGGAPAGGARRTGELDRDTIGRLIERHVVPAAKACYDRALRQQPALTGSLVVVLEIARGEIQLAHAVDSTLAGAGLEACVTDAAYAIPVPRVALGDDPETIGLARYPLVFRVRGDRGAVEQGPDYDLGEIEIDLDDPLGGLDR